jgi:23S rRNA pseudouridine2605 synthase
MTERRETDQSFADGERIAKYLASAGVASRRDVERMIADGRVSVEGRKLDTAAFKVTGKEKILVDGLPIARPDATRLWRYHKPVGLMTTNKDPEGRPTIFDDMPEGLPRVLTVGRLDINTEGLLLLTNDGELARALELPSTGLQRTYRARAYGRVRQEELDRLRDGIVHEGVEYKSIIAKLDRVTGSNCWIEVTLTEGKNREVRRALETLGLKVNRLIRVSYGPFRLDDLGAGALEEVEAAEVLSELSDHISDKRRPTPFARRDTQRAKVKDAKAQHAKPLHARQKPRPMGDPEGRRKGLNSFVDNRLQKNKPSRTGRGGKPTAGGKPGADRRSPAAVSGNPTGKPMRGGKPGGAGRPGAGARPGAPKRPGGKPVRGPRGPR